jgi:hypothetical protein
MNSIVRPALSHRLPRAAVILLALVAALIWLVASIQAPPIAPFEPTDQPIQRSLAQAPDRPVVLSSSTGRRSADYWSEVGKLTGAF